MYNKKEYNKNYQRTHREKIRELNKKYYHNNIEKIRKKHRLYKKEYYIKNREKCIAQSREYKRTHKEQIKEYDKKHSLRYHYGLSIIEFNNILLAQNNRCAICNEPLDLQNSKNVHIDHDHKTGKIRGILCQKCNLAIGLLRDNPEYTKRATEYLERDKYPHKGIDTYD